MTEFVYVCIVHLVNKLAEHGGTGRLCFRTSFFIFGVAIMITLFTPTEQPNQFG